MHMHLSYYFPWLCVVQYNSFLVDDKYIFDAIENGNRRIDAGDLIGCRL